MAAGRTSHHPHPPANETDEDRSEGAPAPGDEPSRRRARGGGARSATSTTSAIGSSIVATDRLSAFDVVLPTGIPGKGDPAHAAVALLVPPARATSSRTTSSTATWPSTPPSCARFRDQLEGRSMIVVKTELLPVECVVRGYLAGSGWKDYKATGAVCGIPLAAGLRESDRLEPPIFTPATKAETGHDENITFEAWSSTVGSERAARGAADEPGALHPGPRARRGAGDHPRRHEVRVRRPRRAARLDRRGADAGLVALLAARRLRAGALAAELRQAVRARLPRDPRLGQAAAGAGAPAGRRRAHAWRSTWRRSSASGERPARVGRPGRGPDHQGSAVP